MRRLAGDLPDFESVWVDALARAGALHSVPGRRDQRGSGRTAGRRRGAYEWSRRGFARRAGVCRVFRRSAHRRPNGGAADVVSTPQRRPRWPPRCLRSWSNGASAGAESLVPGAIFDAGTSGGELWAACDATRGVTAAEWMVENGRFPPRAVWHIAREMSRQLSSCTASAWCMATSARRGSCSTSRGTCELPMGGLRGIARPNEGYSFADLQPEAYDYLAPERIGEGGPPTVASDVYACGCLWCICSPAAHRSPAAERAGA